MSIHLCVALMCVCSYLHVTGDTYGRPIHGQKEVSAAASPSELSYWKALEGIYIKPSGSVTTQIDHDEF